MENVLNELLAQKAKLEDELMSISNDEKSILIAIELNNQLINKLINKSIETTNEQSIATCYSCNKPAGYCTCL